MENLGGAIGTIVSKVAVTTLAKNAVSRQVLECARRAHRLCDWKSPRLIPNEMLFHHYICPFVLFTCFFNLKLYS